MRVLLDTCVWGGCLPDLVEGGHEVEWAGSWPRDPGDEAILEYAHRTAQILVTLDKDFGELAIVRRVPHSGIIRLVGGSVTTLSQRILSVLAKYGEDLAAGAIVTAETGRIRIRTGGSSATTL